MKNSTLAEIFYSLTTSELDEFEQFLRSPWCNDYARPEEQLALLNYFKKDPEPDKDSAYPFVFKDADFVANKLEKLMSATMKSLRRWLLLRRRDSEVEENIQLAAFYSSRSLLERHDLTIAHARAALDKKHPHELRDYLLRYQLEYEIATHLTLHNLKKDDANFNNTLLALDRFYLAARLKNTALLLLQNRLVPVEMYPARHFLAPMLEELRPYEQVMAPLVLTYEQLLAMVADDESFSLEDLNRLLEFLDAQASLLDTETLDNAEAFASSWCTMQYNRSRYEFLPVLYELVLRRLQSGRIYKNGLLGVHFFQLAVVVGLRMKKLDWVNTFLEEHRGRLVGGKQSEEAWNFNRARYLLHAGDYEQALDLLAANYEITQYKIAAKVLEIQALYDSDSPLLDSKLDAAKIFFFREKKIPDDKKALYNDFVDMMKQILNPKTLHSPPRIQKLIEKVQALPGIAERDWVLEKLEALLKRR